MNIPRVPTVAMNGYPTGIGQSSIAVRKISPNRNSIPMGLRKWRTASVNTIDRKANEMDYAYDNNWVKQPILAKVRPLPVVLSEIQGAITAIGEREAQYAELLNKWQKQQEVLRQLQAHAAAKTPGFRRYFKDKMKEIGA